MNRRGETVLLDADPQGSARHWARVGGAESDLPPVRGVAANNVKTSIGVAAGECRFVLVDCPPHLQSDALSKVMESVDLLLIPIQPSPLDLWASIELTSALQEAVGRNPGLRAYMVLNQLDSRNSLSRSMHEALADLFISSAHELEDSVEKIMLLLNAAHSQRMMGDLQNALSSLRSMSIQPRITPSGCKMKRKNPRCLLSSLRAANT